MIWGTKSGVNQQQGYGWFKDFTTYFQVSIQKIHAVIPSTCSDSVHLHISILKVHCRKISELKKNNTCKPRIGFKRCFKNEKHLQIWGI